MPTFNPAQMEKKSGFEPLPAGDYRVLILEAKHYDAKGYDQLSMKWEVLEPSDKAKKTCFIGLFYNDFKINDLVKAITGKTIEQNFPGDNSIAQEKIFDLLTGEHVKVKLGIKEYNGKKSNTLVEVLTEKKKESQAPADV